MKEKKTKTKLRINANRQRTVELLRKYDYYDYEVFVTDISHSSTLIVLEYRSGFQNVYQSITIVVTKVDDISEIIIYESKTTVSLSNLLCRKKEVERIMDYLRKSNVEIIDELGV